MMTAMVSIAEAAEILRVSRRTIHRMIRDGQLYAPKVRRRRLISMTTIESILGPDSA